MDFHMAEVLLFFQELFRQYFIDITYRPDFSSTEAPKDMLKILRRHLNMGNHTDLMVWFPLGIDKFYYSHDVRRPFGKPSPMQCSKCGAIRSWRLGNAADRKSFAEEFNKTTGVSLASRAALRAKLRVEKIILKCKVVGCDHAVEIVNDTGLFWQDGAGSSQEGHWKGVRKLFSA